MRRGREMGAEEGEGGVRLTETERGGRQAK